MSNEIHYFPDEKYTSFLSDESLKSGKALSISFPKGKDELEDILEKIGDEPFVVQGQRTGYRGLCVPDDQHIINMTLYEGIIDSGFDECGGAYITANAGTTLESLRLEILKRFKGEYFWPPSPSELTATIGGIIASNAGGINSVYYGDCDKYICSIDTLAEGRIITSARLRLLKRPPCIMGVAFFFSENESALSFCDRICGEKKSEDAFISSLVYFDPAAISLLEKSRQENQVLKNTPMFPDDSIAMVYIEISSKDDKMSDEMLFKIIEKAEANGADSEKAWALSGEKECEKVRSLRHCVTELSLNQSAAYNRDDSKITFLYCNIKGSAQDFKLRMDDIYKELDKTNSLYTICAKPTINEIEIMFTPDSYEMYCRCKDLINLFNERYST